MPLDPQAEALLESLEALSDPPIETSTPEAIRALRRSRVRPPTIALDDVRDVDAGGVPCRLYRAKTGAGEGLLLYFHGGGWVLGDLDTHDHVARALAARSGHAVLSVGYRLAPEHPFPAPLDDAVRATRWAYENASRLGLDPGRLALSGDSAGANLAAVVSQRGDVPLCFQLLVYPVTDARCTSPSYEEFRDGPYLTAAAMRWFVAHYLSGCEGSADDPRVSPLLADDNALRASPPTRVVTAELDVLRDEGEAYARRLAGAGAPVTLDRRPGLFHGFMSFWEQLDEGEAALVDGATAVTAALAG